MWRWRKFSLATSETYRDKSGQPHTTTDWHSVVLWRGLAELAQAYLRKGSLVYLEGKLKTRHYDDAAGVAALRDGGSRRPAANAGQKTWRTIAASGFP